MMIQETSKPTLVKETKIVLLFVLGTGVVIAGGMLFFRQKPVLNAEVKGVTNLAQSLPVVEDLRPTSPVVLYNSPPPEVSARSVLILDLGSRKVLYEKNPEQAVPIASLTKLMTAIVAYNFLSLDDTAEVRAADLQISPYRVGLVAGEKVRIRDLLAAMLVASANDAAQVLAREALGSPGRFVEEMNRTAAELRMTSTNFVNPVGFDHDQHYSTAVDIARLVNEFVNYPELMDMVRLKSGRMVSADGRYSHAFSTTNKLLLKNPLVMGLKTGYTAEAKGNLIIMTDQYFSIVLGSDSREDETEQLMIWIEENVQWP